MYRNIFFPIVINLSISSKFSKLQPFAIIPYLTAGAKWLQDMKKN